MTVPSNTTLAFEGSERFILALFPDVNIGSSRTFAATANLASISVDEPKMSRYFPSQDASML